jgi:hypothetical protein
MSDREILLRWLAAGAARLGWSRRTRELGRAACALLGLWLVAEVLHALGVPPQVLWAVVPLLAIAALAAVALFAWRIGRATTLAQAAGAADTRASLKDELQSAYWFTQRAMPDAFVERLLTRAARTASRLELRRVFPLGVPRSVMTAVTLALLTGALAWLSPRIAFPVLQRPMPAPASAASGKTGAGALAEDRIGTAAPRPADSNAVKQDDPNAAWSQLDRLTGELPAGARQDAVKRAIAARDARLAAQLLEAAERNRAAAVAQDPGVRPQQEMRSAAETQRLLEALKGLSNPHSKAPIEPPIKAEVSSTIRTATRLREQAREERRKITGAPAQGEVTLNSRLRAISRAGAGMREVSYGEGEAAEAGSQTSVSGAASGDRTGRSQAGGSEGEHPNSSPTGAGDDQPVLGERTERLAAQLEKMSAERSEDPKQQQAVEEFYVSTQRQASEVEYESVATRWRTQGEAVVAPGGTPLPYREAVKRYFLSQHAKED